MSKAIEELVEEMNTLSTENDRCDYFCKNILPIIVDQAFRKAYNNLNEDEKRSLLKR